MAAIDILLICLVREKDLSARGAAPIYLRTKVRRVLVAGLLNDVNSKKVDSILFI